MVFTAIGDTVNVAARLQDTTKTLHCTIIVSEEVCKTSGEDSGRSTSCHVATAMPTMTYYAKPLRATLSVAHAGGYDDGNYKVQRMRIEQW